MTECMPKNRARGSFEESASLDADQHAGSMLHAHCRAHARRGLRGPASSRASSSASSALDSSSRARLCHTSSGPSQSWCSLSHSSGQLLTVRRAPPDPPCALPPLLLVSAAVDGSCHRTAPEPPSAAAIPSAATQSAANPSPTPVNPRHQQSPSAHHQGTRPCLPRQHAPEQK